MFEEGIRWKETVEIIEKEKVNIIGDVFLSTAIISYCGPFTGISIFSILNPIIIFCIFKINCLGKNN